LKHLGSVLTLIAFAFWATMNTLVVVRERELANLDQYRAGVTSFLGSEFQRERWMTIYQNRKPIGYTGGTFEKVFALEGIEIRQTMESVVRLPEPIGKIRLAGTLVADKDLIPVSLRATVSHKGQPAATISGEQKDGKFRVTVSTGLLPFPPIDLPLEELHLGDALGPGLPIAGFRVGDAFRVPCFDPIALKRELATVKVISKQAKEIDGVRAELFCLETTFRGFTSKSWVNNAGELFTQEFGPPFEGIVLKRATRQEAQAMGKE